MVALQQSLNSQCSGGHHEPTLLQTRQELLASTIPHAHQRFRSIYLWNQATATAGHTGWCLALHVQFCSRKLRQRCAHAQQLYCHRFTSSEKKRPGTMGLAYLPAVMPCAGSITRLLPAYCHQPVVDIDCTFVVLAPFVTSRLHKLCLITESSLHIFIMHTSPFLLFLYAVVCMW